jgi:GWxTD domain-containing protein
MKTTKCVLLYIFMFGQFCFSQKIPLTESFRKNDSLAKFGENLVFYGKTRDADEIFSKIKIDDGNSSEEQLINGRFALAKYDLIKARDLLEGAIKTNRNDINLYYYLGIVCRELAANQSSLIMPDRTKKRSKECFERVLKQDSSYKDICFQYGLLLNSLGKTAEAINMMIRQIKLKPGMMEPYIGLRNIGLNKILDNKSEDNIENVIENFKNINDEGYKKYLEGELLRIKGRQKEAEILYSGLLKDYPKIPVSMIYNSLLKLYAKSGERKKTEKLFWEAVNSINNNLESDILFYELKFISKPGEIGKYRISSFYERKNDFFSNFWERHNPNPGIKNNPRIYEHYKRLAEAEEEYCFFRERYYYYKCKTDEYTDQGLIYIRFGKPDKIIMSSVSRDCESGACNYKSASDPALMLYEKDPMLIASNKQLNFIESWYYENSETASYQEYHFWGKNKKFLTYLVDEEALRDREMMDPLYTQILNTSFNTINGRRVFRSTPEANEKVEKNIQTVKEGLIYEKSSVGKEIIKFSITGDIYTFRSSDGKTSIDLAYLINKSYIFKTLPDSLTELKLECNLSIYDTAGNKILFNTDTITIKRQGKGSDSEFRFHRLDLTPDSCEIILAIHPINQEIYGKSIFNINIPDYSNKKLMISDIELGIERKSGSEIFKKNGKILLPKANPAHNLKTPLSAYYEIYNLKKNSDGKSMYKMEYNMKYNGSENLLSKLFSSGDRKNSISMEYYQTGKEETAKEFINFELNKLIPGKYILEIKITDVYASKTIVQKRDIELYEN